MEAERNIRNVADDVMYKITYLKTIFVIWQMIKSVFSNTTYSLQTVLRIRVFDSLQGMLRICLKKEKTPEGLNGSIRVMRQSALLAASRA